MLAKRFALLATLLLFGAAPAPPVLNYANWPGYGGAGENHYSDLKQINAGNVARLGLASHYDIDTGGSSLTAPVAVDGILYFAAGLSVVHAVDAATGKLLWQYDPGVGRVAGDKLRAAWGSRGIAYAHGQVFTGTVDGRLIAINAKTGKPAWSVMTVKKGDGRYISGAPWVFNDMVLIGHGGADFAPVRGYVTAYKQKTGKQAWRFYTVPGDPAQGFENKAMAMAAETWTGQWWKYGGGATVWNAMAFDPKLNRIYIGTGNGSPWNRKIRSPGGGDNLFVCAIVALDATTGEYIWHYQVNPGETWDYNAAMDMELADLLIDGKVRQVLMQAPKNGFFYVLDRVTGKLISAKTIVPINWASGINALGRPTEKPEARFPDGKPAIVYPSPFGAHNIEAMSFNPVTGLAYIPVMDQGRVYVDPASGIADWVPLKGQRISNGIGVPPDLPLRKPTSALLAWNPVTQTEVWRIPLRGPRGGGGTATTAGNLLLQGRAAGQFVILAADTGKQLWSFDAQTAVMAQPITYLAHGKQYVTVIAGSRFPTAQGFKPEWSYATQQWRVLTFALDGKDRLPPAETVEIPYADDPDFKVDPARAAAGGLVFGERCAICHGAGARSGGAAPDLLRSAIPTDAAAFESVLHDGPLVERGMPRFAELAVSEIEALRHYLRQRARQDATQSANPRSPDAGQ
jgi:quinohemoprotein ethanol dehydrogenase